jgi:DNA-binding PadR family transcriptional regulator
MSDALALEADPYHTLGLHDRDHLLAAALLNAKRDTLPAGTTVGETVGRLTGSSPNPNTTNDALGRLEAAGFIERDPDEPAGRSKGVRVTDDGHRALERGAARLDAAATVETDAIAEVNEGP